VTYDPNNPNRIPRLAQDDKSFVTIAFIGIAIAMGLTVLVYAFRSTDSDMNALDKPGSTTGQSRKAPAPAPYKTAPTTPKSVPKAQ
jgi:hypothetical protein